MAKNWEAMGIKWDESEVSRQHGAHATDRVVLGKGQAPVIVDWAKALEAFGEGPIMSGCNKTSWRVLAQDVSRTCLEKGTKDVEAIRDRVYNRIMGLRNSGIAGTTRTVTVEVKVYPLPGGSFTPSTDDATEGCQEYASALMDAGLDPAIALAMAKGIFGL